MLIFYSVYIQKNSGKNEVNILWFPCVQIGKNAIYDIFEKERNLGKTPGVRVLQSYVYENTHIHIHTHIMKEEKKPAAKKQHGRCGGTKKYIY